MEASHHQRLVTRDNTVDPLKKYYSGTYLIKTLLLLNTFVYAWSHTHATDDMWVVPFVSDNLEGSEINIRPTTEFIFYDVPVFPRSANSVRKSDRINQFTFACRYLNSNSQHDTGHHLISVLKPCRDHRNFLIFVRISSLDLSIQGIEHRPLSVKFSPVSPET